MKVSISLLDMIPYFSVKVMLPTIVGLMAPIAPNATCSYIDNI